jgi:hypothetical protein
MAVDSSPEQKTRVQLLMRQTAAGIDTTKADIDTCRDIFRAIRGEKEIRIPMEISEGILGLENRANEIILAMVCAVAVFNGHDTAAKEASERALKIYWDIGAHSINKLTKAEKDQLKALLREEFFKNGRYMAIAEELAEALGKGRNSITQTWRGRNVNEGHKSYGLTSKVPELDTETVLVTEAIAEFGSSRKVTEQKKVFYYVFNIDQLEAAELKWKCLV